MTDTNKQALEVLKNHQKWRKGCDETPATNPKELSEAIDTAIAALQPKPNLKHKDIVEIARNFLERWDGGLAIGSAIEEMQKVIQDLQPKPSVDVEILKEEIEEIISDTHDIDVQDKHYAQNIINHLTSQGYLNQGWQPIATCPNDVNVWIYCDNGEIKFIEASENDYSWVRYDVNQNHLNISKPKYWSPAIIPQPPKSEDE